MKPRSIVLSTLLVLPRCFAGAAAVPDADGCKDLALFSRVSGCVIIECSSKQKDSIPFQVNAQLERAIEGDSASAQYSCAGDHPPGQIAKKLAGVMSKAGYQVVFRDTEDPGSALITARKGPVWVQLSASTDDNGTLYSMTSVDSASQVFNPEPCSDPGLFAMPAGCRITECRAKKDDRVEMRTGDTGQAALLGTTRTVSIGCQTGVNAAQMFESAQTGFHSAGLNVLFSDNTRPDNSWLTVRSGSRWAELISFENGDGIAYQLTGATANRIEDVQGGEAVATAAVSTHQEAAKEALTKEAAAVEVAAASKPAPAKASNKPAVEMAQARPPVALMPVVTVIKSNDAPAGMSMLHMLTASSLPRPGGGPVTPPRPLRRVPLALSDGAKSSIQSDVTVRMWVDVNDDGWPVASAPVSEKLSKDEAKIAEAANASLLQWRFQPAMQAGKRVSSRLEVPMKFTKTQFRLNVPNFIH